MPSTPLSRLVATVTVALTFIVATSTTSAATRTVPTPEWPTLQHALDASADGDIVAVLAGTLTGPGNVGLTLTDRTVTVRGAGADDTIIDAAGTTHGFVVAGGSVAIEDLRIRGGIANTGAGIGVLAGPIGPGELTLRGVTIDACTARERGGGLHATAGTITLETTSIIDCHAPTGAAIAVDGTADATWVGGSITACTAAGGSGLPAVAIASEDGELGLDTVTMSNNRVAVTGAAAAAADGGSLVVRDSLVAEVRRVGSTDIFEDAFGTNGASSIVHVTGCTVGPLVDRTVIAGGGVVHLVQTTIATECPVLIDGQASSLTIANIEAGDRVVQGLYGEIVVEASLFARSATGDDPIPFLDVEIGTALHVRDSVFHGAGCLPRAVGSVLGPSAVLRDTIFTGPGAPAAMDITGFGSIALRSVTIESLDDAQLHLAVRTADDPIELTDVLIRDSRGPGPLLTVAGGRLRMSETTFADNQIQGSGGAMRLDGLTGPATIAGSTLRGNTTEGSGGAIVFGDGAQCDITLCTFRDNEAAGQGGAIAIDAPNGIGTVRATLTAVQFIDNVAQRGGAVRIAGDEADVHFVSCLLAGNVASIEAGALILTQGGRATLAASTVAANPAPNDTAILVRGDGSLVEVIGSIVTDGASGPAGGSGGPIDAQFAGVASALTSIIEGGYPGVGVLDVDPRFVDPAAGDFRLRACSPAVDLGVTPFLPADADDLDGDGDLLEPMPVDAAGAPRVIDDPAAANAGIPWSGGSMAIVDLGGLERQPGPCDADVDRSGTVGFGDLVLALADWGPCAACPSDLDCDDAADLDDLLSILAAWGTMDCAFDG